MILIANKLRTLTAALSLAALSCLPGCDVASDAGAEEQSTTAALLNGYIICEPSRDGDWCQCWGETECTKMMTSGMCTGEEECRIVQSEDDEEEFNLTCSCDVKRPKNSISVSGSVAQPTTTLGR